MNYIELALRRLPRDMRAAELRWALVGGFAVSSYAGARATMDIDVAVAVASDREVDGAVHRLRALGYSVATFMEDDQQRLSTVRLRCPTEDERELLLDLLVRTSGIEAEVVDAAIEREVLPGYELPVARLYHLLAMKVLSESEARLQDNLDIQMLLTVASPADIERAREAVELIRKRGTARSKDVSGRFDELVALHGGN